MNNQTLTPESKPPDWRFPGDAKLSVPRVAGCGVSVNKPLSPPHITLIVTSGTGQSPETEREGGRDIERQREGGEGGSKRERERERERGRERESGREGRGEREGDREWETERETETEREGERRAGGMTVGATSGAR